MSEATVMTETPQTPTDGASSSEASSSTVLTSMTGDDNQQQQGEKPKEGQQNTADAPKPAEGDKPAETKTEGAPESYTFTAPEGKTYDSAVIDSFSAAAKEANLTQDAAQKIVDSMAPALAERQAAQIKQVQDGWKAATEKEFGGDNLKQTSVYVATAMKAFDPLPAGQNTTPFRTLLEQTGLGNNPDFVRVFVQAGKAISEDTFVKGSSAQSTPKRMADIMYDNTK